MRAERREGLHRHVALISTASDVSKVPTDTSVVSSDMSGSGLSLLRLSVPARLAMVAVAAALLWAAVLWALS